MIVLEIRALPLEPIRRALIADLGGSCGSDGRVVGEGWSARFVPLPPAPVGALSIPAFRIAISGPNAGAAADLVRALATRGGG